jgi:hypothetical protein
VALVSITIKHNFKLSPERSKHLLKVETPAILCERMLVEADAKEEQAKAA